MNVLVLHTPLLVLALSLPAASADDGREGVGLSHERSLSRGEVPFHVPVSERTVKRA